jgi:ABC-type phosphate/phosphonate transport system, periplasmic component
MKLFLKTILILSLTLGINSAVSAKTYNMAVTDIEGMDALISEWGPFKEALEKATGDTFEFFAVSNQTATAEALRGKKLDFAITGPAEYVR